MKLKMDILRFVLAIAAFLLFSQPLYPQTCAAAETSLEVSGLQVDISQSGSQLMNVVTIDEEALLISLKANPAAAKIVIPVSGREGIVKVCLTGQLLKLLNGRVSFIEIEGNAGSMVLPVSVLGDKPINIIIDGTGGKQGPEMAKMIAAEGYDQLASPVQFKVEAADGNETVESDSFEDYVKSTVTLPGEVNINQAVGIGLSKNGTLVPVPTQFTVQDGKTSAVIKHKSGGVFAVIAHKEHFSDTEGHWSSGIIDILASKLIVSGTGADAFLPDGEINRAEFAAVIIRAMGLDSGQDALPFKDVGEKDWFAGAVGAASKAGLISGYADGTFRPYDKVTREQAAVVLTKVMQTVDKSSGLDGSATETSLTRFADSASISSWARPYAAFAGKNALIAGDSRGLFNPQKPATRAEAAVMVKKVMGMAGLLSPTFDVGLPEDKSVTDHSGFAITGSVEKGSIVTVNGTETAVTAGGQFNASLELRPGTNLIRVEITDPWGNVSVLSRSIRYQPESMDLVISPAPGLVTNRSSITVTGAAQPGSAVTVNNSQITANIDGRYSKPLSLNIGKNLVTVTGTGVTGNEITEQRMVIYDNIPPEITVAAPSDNMETADNFLVVTGYTEPDCVVTINGKTVQTDSRGNFSQAVDLSAYSNKIIVEATDAAGNKTAVERVVQFRSNRIESFKLPALIKIGARNFIQYTLGVDGYVTMKIYDSDGKYVRGLLIDSFGPAGDHTLNWDGRDLWGEPVRDGNYRFVMEEKDAGGSPLGRAELTQLAARFPAISNLRVVPASLNPESGGRAEITFDIPWDALVTAEVYKKNEVIKVLAGNHRETAGTVSLSWDGRDNKDIIAEDGRYTLLIKAANPVDEAFSSTARGFVTVEKEMPAYEKASLAVRMATDASENTAGGTVTPEQEAPSISGVSLGQGTLKLGSSINLRYTLSENCSVDLKVVDINGNLVRNIFTGLQKKAGPNSASWDGKDNNGRYCPEGSYKFVINAVDNLNNPAGEQVIAFYAGYLPGLQDVAVTPSPYNPNDGDAGLLSIEYTVDHDAVVTAKVMNRSALVKSLLNAQKVNQGRNVLQWDGRDSSNNIAGDGDCYILLEAASPTVTGFKSVYRAPVIIEKEAPGITGISFSPSPFKLTSAKRLSIKYLLSEDARVSIGVYQNDRLIKSIASEAPGRAGTGFASWDGRNSEDRVVDEGIYTVKIKAVDAFGKTGESSWELRVITNLAAASAEPGNNAPVDSKIIISFTEPLQRTVDFRHISIQVEGREVLYRGSSSGSKIVLTPSAELAYGTAYTVYIAEDAVEDRSGRHLPEPYSYTFTTEGAPRPDFDVLNLSDAITSDVSEIDTRIATSVTVDEEKALAAAESAETIRLALIPVIVNSDMVRTVLSANLISTLAAKEALLQVRSPKASLVVPASALDLNELAVRLGVEAPEMSVSIVMEAAESDRTLNLQSWARNQGLTVISGPVQFKIEAAAGDKTLEITNLDGYASFILHPPEGIAEGMFSGVELNDGSAPVPMPTVGFNEKADSGAGIRSRNPGTFAVVKSPVDFGDLRTHWAREDINLLAARQIVSGISRNSFAPDRAVTRSQFAVMITKALGLRPGSQAAVFTDAEPGAWYNGYLAAGVAAGIVSGFADKTFKPEQSISREEAAVLLVRAREWINARSFAPASGATAALGRFQDKNGISRWARDYVAEAVSNGLMQGYANGTFAPVRSISRAECAVVLRKLLTRTGLI